MADTPASQNFSNPETLKGILPSSSDIKATQEQSVQIGNPPQLLVQWLLKINRRQQGASQENQAGAK